MSNLIDINELRKQFAEKLSSEEWQTFSAAQNSIIASYEKQLQFLQEKNAHLEKLLSKNNKLIIEPLEPEEAICIQQIRLLEESSSTRHLTLEEVKKLDLLVKNLKLIREESTVIIQNKEEDSLSEADLVAIAQSQPTS